MKIGNFLLGLFALLAFTVTVTASAETLVVGPITNLALTYDLGASPGLDRFDASGNYVLGAGSNGLSLPSDFVLVSFDSGRFVQALPANSFVAITGGFKYVSTNPGITLFKIMNDGTFTLQVRNIDLTGVNRTNLGSFEFSVGDDSFSAVPNSIPVARISGPASATVGVPISLDGSLSSDLNQGTNLIYTWSILSKPAGSTAELTSTNSPTTSLTVEKNGYFVIKLSVSDGISDGVAALLTIEATGGPEDPPPAPSPENGLILLTADKPDYIINESASLSVNVIVGPGSAIDEYFYRAYLDEQPVELTEITNTELRYTTAAFQEPGEHTFRVSVYLQNRNLNKQYADTLANFQDRIAKINLALANETDESIIAKLQAEKAMLEDEIAKVQVLIEKNRTKLSGDAVLSFSVL